MGASRYRRLFLFLVILILPSVAIIVQGRKIAGQERDRQAEELRKRTETEERRTAAEIGQELLARLERIKLQEISNIPAGAIPRSTAYSEPAVVAVGWVEGERLVWPWDVTSTTREQAGASENAEFARAIEQGERVEFGEKRYDTAATFYRQAVNAARNDSQRAEARLRLARTLRHAEAQPGANAVYREMLKLPSQVMDEQGIPYMAYAALRLAELGTSGEEVLDRVQRDLETPAALTPFQTYRLKEILEGFEKSKTSTVQARAKAALDRLQGRVKDIDQALRLQQDFAKLRINSEAWQPYENGALWLIGETPTGAGSRRLVVAAKAETLRAAVETARAARQAGPSFKIAVNVSGGQALAERLPGLRATFPSGVVAVTTSPDTSQPWLSGMSFALVVAFTFLAGLLLWRDMRREAHIAVLRTQFVSSVSHELKTPLTSIRMFAELMQMSGDAGPKHAGFLETIVSESERLTRLLNNVLDFSRIERGQKTYRRESTSLADVVHAAVRTIQYPLTEQGFVLDLNVSEGIPRAAVDRDALQQAILNLLTNAMKYSGNSREIGLRLDKEDGAAVIQVSDNGIGIPEKDQPRIFEKFYRASTPENREISGTGLGLALVAHIAEAHGGTVDVKSKLGKGSTFSIRLPLNGSSAA